MTLSKWRNLSRRILFISIAFTFAILLLYLLSWIFATFSIFFRLPTSRYLSSNLYILYKSSYPLHHRLQWPSVPVFCFSLFENALFICSVTHCLSSFHSVHFSRSVVSDSLRPHELQHVRPPCPSPTPGVHSDSCPSSRWCHPAISSSVVPFSSCPQSLPASESFQMSQLFTWGGQSTKVSALASVLPKKSQGWSLEWTGWICLQSMGLSRVFSNTTVQKHQFFDAQLSSQANSHIHTWLLEKP